MDHEFSVTIIGAGVVGLAVAARLARPGLTLCLIERHPTFGQEASSRNSEIIHSGIYDPGDSLKTTLCIQGRNMIYEMCEAYDIPCRRTGKLVVACAPDEVLEVEELAENGRRNGVADLVLLSRSDLRRLEPNVSGEAALLSPSTGIVDSHALMRHFERIARANDAVLLYNAEVVGLEKTAGGFRVRVRERTGELDVVSRIVVNAAGLSSDRIAEWAGADVDAAGYRIHPCKGEYFSVTKRPETEVRHLIYPVPRLESGGLGVHVTIDLRGDMKLGPNAFYVRDLDYNVDPGHRALFYESARTYLPRLRPEDIQPSMAGIRPKLREEGEGFRDFVIREESDRGLPGLVNLIGIESPGLTSAPAIGAYVAGMVNDVLS